MSDMKRLLEAMDGLAEGRSGNTITRLRSAPAAAPAATQNTAAATEPVEPPAPKIEVPQGYRAKATTGVAPMPSGETPPVDPFAQKRAAAAAKAQSQMTPAPAKPAPAPAATQPAVWKNNRSGQVGTSPITKPAPVAAPTTTPSDLGRLAGVKTALPKGVAGNEYTNIYPAMGSKFQDQQYMKDVKSQLDKYPNDPNLNAEYSDLTKKSAADKLPEASAGTKFPGYWKGSDPASKAKDKMVGGCEESIIKDLHAIAESKSTEWRLEEAYRQFKEAPEYGGIDPIVRNRMGMPPATQDEIRTHLDKNPPVVTSRSGEPVKTGTGQNVQSGGQVNVAKAADAVSPDRANSVAKEPGSTAQQGVQVNPIPDRPDNSVTVTPVPDRPSAMTSTLPPAASAPVVAKAQSFNQAFAAARANQMKTNPSDPSGGRFSWNGKTYHTGRADDVKPSVAKPAAAPAVVKPNTTPAATKPVTPLAKPAYTPPADYVPNGKTSPTGHPWAPITYNSSEKAGEKPEASPAPVVATTPTEKPKIKPFRRFNEQDNEKIAGRYDPDDFDELVRRVGQKAKEQDRKHGPVDIAALAKKLRDFEKREQTKEQEDPATNKQDPDSQVTSQVSPQQDPAAMQQQRIDQQQSFATAKGTMSGLKTALGPQVDTNQLTNAVTKISSGQALSGPEASSMSALTPLIAKAAQTPQTAMALKTALSNAAMIAKQGK